MDADKISACVESYRRLKHLKLVGTELGIPWQTVYVCLRAANEPVTGDKARYGSDSDRLAAKGEQLFLSLVPSASSDNTKGWQAKVDFHVAGAGVDVKCALLRRGSWAFSIKKQRLIADYFVCFAFDADSLAHVLLLPSEIVRQYSTIRLDKNATNKWSSYQVAADSLATFFAQIQGVAA